MLTSYESTFSRVRQLIIPSHPHVRALKPLCTGHLRTWGISNVPHVTLTSWVTFTPITLTWGFEEKKWGRREGEWMSLTCLQPFAHRPLRGVMWVCEGHYRIPWFFASESLDNRNHLKFASATGGRSFRFLLAPRPHVAEGASASFGACLCFLRVNSLKPSDCPSNTCLSYYSERNFEYSRSISD